MAVRVKDRIEANIRQSDKVNNSLSIQLNSGTATVYDGSAAKSVNVTPAAINAVNKSGDTMTGVLNAHGGITLNSTTQQSNGPEYILGIKAFASGGNVVWASKANVSVGAADKLTTSAGSSTLPVYFSNGKPAATGTSLAVSITGNAATATRIASSVNLASNSTTAAVYWNPFTWEITSSWSGCTGIYTLSDTEGNFNGIFRVKFRTGSTATTLSSNTVNWLSASTTSPPVLTLTTTINSTSITYKLYITAPGTYRTYRISKIVEEGIASTIATNYVTSMSGTAQSTSSSLAVAWDAITGKPSTFTPSSHTHSYLPLSGGTLTGLLTVSTNSRYVVLGCQNQSFAHYSTNSDSGHWFNTNVYVQGDIYCGSSYNQKVISAAGGYLNNQLISHSVNGGAWIHGTHSAAFVVDTATSASAGNYYQGWYSGKTPLGAWSLGCLAGNESMYFVYGSDANFNTSTNTTAQLRMESSGILYGAAWNDYAEFRTTAIAKAGEVVVENGNGTMHRSYKRLEPAASIVSDTYGFAIGETEKCGTPIAVAGRVLAYPYEDRNSYKAGDAVCSAPDGKISKMSLSEMVMYPNCIIGYVSEIPEYEVWGQTDVPVDGRIWIKI